MECVVGAGVWLLEANLSGSAIPFLRAQVLGSSPYESLISAKSTLEDED